MSEVEVHAEDILLTHFIVSEDVEGSWRFYTEALGGKVVFRGAETGPVNVKLSNSWIVINVGEVQPTTSQQSPWRHLAIPTGSVAF